MPEIVDIITPKKILLNGLLFGSRKTKRGFIFVHGLSSSVFSKLKLVEELAKIGAVLTFNNRGHDKVTRVLKLDSRSRKGYRSLRAGGAHEVFTECHDDLQGAVDFMKKRGMNEIILMGHSTGCQKIVYYLANSQNKVKGAVLLCPMSDYAFALREYGRRKLGALAKLAQKLVRSNKAHQLLPPNLWPHYDDAQRFLSLYTPQSKENIFPYDDSAKPTALNKIRTPLLVVLAEKDEYRDRPIKKIRGWFINRGLTTVIIPDALHSLQGREKQVVSKITSLAAKDR